MSDDQDRIRKIANEDPEEFSRLLEECTRTAKSVHYYRYARHNDFDIDCEQIALDACYKLYKHLSENANHIRSLKAVTISIVRREYITALRKKLYVEDGKTYSRENYSYLSEEKNQFLSIDTSPSTVNQVHTDYLRECQKTLTERYQEMFEWYAAGYGPQDIAEKVGIQHKSVPPILHRIRKMLKTCIENKHGNS